MFKFISINFLLLIKKIQFLINKFYLFQIYFYKYLNKDLKKKKRRKIRFYKKILIKIWVRISDEKIFYKYLFSSFFLLFFRPTPKRIFKLIKWIYIKMCWIYRTCYFIFMTHNLSHKYCYYFIFTTVISLLFVKFLQEVFIHFSCPAATYLYGKFKLKKRKWKEEKLKKEAQKKLHKFVANPFYTKAEKRKIQEDKDKKENALKLIYYQKLNVKRKDWKKKKIIYLIEKEEALAKRRKKVIETRNKKLKKKKSWFKFW